MSNPDIQQVPVTDLTDGLRASIKEADEGKLVRRNRTPKTDFSDQLVSVSCDAVVFSSREDALGMAVHVLLVTRKNDPYAGLLALPGGFLNPDETLRECVIRELKEETGLVAKPLLRLSDRTDPKRDPRGRTITFPFLFVVPGCPDVLGSDDATSAEWVNINKFNPEADVEPAIAFDHWSITQEAVDLILNIGATIRELITYGHLDAIRDLSPRMFG